MDPKHQIALSQPHMADVRAGSGVAPRKNLFKFIVVKKNFKKLHEAFTEISLWSLYIKSQFNWTLGRISGLRIACVVYSVGFQILKIWYSLSKLEPNLGRSEPRALLGKQKIKASFIYCHDFSST